MVFVFSVSSCIADFHIQISTPTVRRHAEACLSTTYAKYPMPHSLSPLGAGISIRSGKMRAVGEGPGRAQVFWVFQLWNQHLVRTISRTIRQNWLKFCMWLPMDIVRTNPYWRFARKSQKVGQKCNFPTKFLTFFSLTVKISPQGHASYPKPC